MDKKHSTNIKNSSDNTGNNLTIFNFDSNDIRSIIDNDGNLWFVARDIFDNLNIWWSGVDSLENIKSNWVMVVNLPTIQRKRGTLMIKEQAVYKLAFRSNKPEAERFTDWLAGEVLPSIRKAGKYSIEEEQVYVPKTYAEALRLAAEKEEEKQLLIVKMEEVIEDNKQATNFHKK